VYIIIISAPGLVFAHHFFRPKTKIGPAL